MLTGIDVLSSDPSAIRNKRIGLLSHQASVSRDLRRTADILRRTDECNLARMFGPEHGFWGVMQDMEGAEQERDAAAGVDIHSLYVVTTSSMTKEELETAKEKLHPRPEWFEDLDALVVDLQDVGARYYTFVYTMKFCMEVAKQTDTEVIVLDRPNPIGGMQVEGNLLEPEWISFVGHHVLPVRHGMTIGELARMFNAEIGCRLTVIPMQGWRREMWWDETGLPWIFPSPNMPALETATVYPGMCLIEATTLSEGRGTTKPFELFGAPGIDPFQLAEVLSALHLPGVVFRPQYFKPMFQKHGGRTCGGVQLHVTDRDSFQPYVTGLWCVKLARDLAGGQFGWRREPYEYEMAEERPAINLLTGTSRFLDILQQDGDLASWISEWDAPLQEFARMREEFLLY
ncbi:MAG TPA: DUF1343 domain-containing protein [Thermoanaerobaculia bacterium]|nr:DUF1343 domain-containing protein [Thermoanaerobaculia bacterium]